MKRNYEVHIGHLKIQHNGFNVEKVFKGKYNKQPYLCTSFQDGQHIIGLLSELPRTDYMKIKEYLKAQYNINV